MEVQLTFCLILKKNRHKLIENEREFSVGGSNFKNWKKEIEKIE
jgi:hypothetical protein